jgi:hypothetical protein
MYCPVGSNRAAKTSPEWPVNSMTGDCSALAREPYSTCQRIAVFSFGTSYQVLVRTYRLYKRTICAGAVHFGYRRAIEIRVWLCALDQLAGAECLVGRSLFSRHVGESYFRYRCGCWM